MYRTKTVAMKLKPISLQLHVYTDASYGVHADMKGHTGTCISLEPDGCFIVASSSKQKLTAKSSCESELIALDTSISPVMALQYLLQEIGMYEQPAIIYQDNMSTIRLSHTGYNTLSKTKHIHMRFFYVKEVADQGHLSIQYLSTDDMVADILTKPLMGYKFILFASMLLNNIIPS